MNTRSMEVISLYEGSYSVDSSKEFKPFDPEVDKKSERPGSLFIHVHPFLLDTPKGLIIFDTGLGFKTNGEATLIRNIKEAGFNPDDVKYVLMSHLHKDHAAGMTVENNGKRKLTFPNATYILQRGEWEQARIDKADSYESDHLEILNGTENLQLVDGDGSIDSFIHFELSGGHSEFHQVFKVEAYNKLFFYGGDEWPEPEQALKRFAAKYDFDGRKAMHLREEYARSAAEHGWICLFYHATGASIARIEANGETFKIIPEL